MKQAKTFLAAAALAAAVAAPAPFAAAEMIICLDDAACRLNQTYGSVFDCVGRRGGQARDDGAGPYCHDIPAVDAAAAAAGAPGCWTDPDHRGAGPLCAEVFADADAECGTIGRRQFVAVHPELDAKHPPGQERKVGPNCRSEKVLIGLKGDQRPDQPAPPEEEPEVVVDPLPDFADLPRECDIAAARATTAEGDAATKLSDEFFERAEAGEFAAGEFDLAGMCNLMTRGMNPNAQDLRNNGVRPLHIAVRAASPPGVFFLLSVGADPALPDAQNNTPLDRALEFAEPRPDLYDPVIAVLRLFEAGCNVNC